MAQLHHSRNADLSFPASGVAEATLRRFHNYISLQELPPAIDILRELARLRPPPVSTPVPNAGSASTGAASQALPLQQQPADPATSHLLPDAQQSPQAGNAPQSPETAAPSKARPLRTIASSTWEQVYQGLQWVFGSRALQDSDGSPRGDRPFSPTPSARARRANHPTPEDNERPIPVTEPITIGLPGREVVLGTDIDWLGYDETAALAQEMVWDAQHEASTAKLYSELSDAAYVYLRRVEARPFASLEELLRYSWRFVTTAERLDDQRRLLDLAWQTPPEYEPALGTSRAIKMIRVMADWLSDRESAYASNSSKAESHPDSEGYQGDVND